MNRPLLGDLTSTERQAHAGKFAELLLHCLRQAEWRVSPRLAAWHLWSTEEGRSLLSGPDTELPLYR